MEENSKGALPCAPSTRTNVTIVIRRKRRYDCAIDLKKRGSASPCAPWNGSDGRRHQMDQDRYGRRYLITFKFNLFLSIVICRSQSYCNVIIIINYHISYFFYRIKRTPVTRGVKTVRTKARKDDGTIVRTEQTRTMNTRDRLISCLSSCTVFIQNCLLLTHYCIFTVHALS